MKGQTVFLCAGLAAVVVLLVLQAVFVGLLWHKSATSSGDLYYDVAMGRRPGMAALSISGRNPSVGSDVNEDLWDGGGDFPAALAYPQVVEVSSESPDDAPEHEGALAVVLEGVGAGYMPLRESVPLKGATPVRTAGKFMAINSMYVAASGSYGVNRGRLLAVAAESRTAMGVVSPTLAKSFAARYTVPANQSLLVHHLIANINQPGDEPVTSAMFMLWVQDSTQGGNLKPAALFGVQASGDGHMERTFQPPLRVPPKSEIYMSVSVSALNVDVSADIDGITVTEAPGLI